MAQTALRLTARENEIEYPEAGTILKRDTYMDDICPSVRTKEEASKIIHDVEKASNEVVLVIFSDASEKAFGACAYARWRLESGSFESRLITAKSRVAPLKKLTVPLLELQAAVMGARLADAVVKESTFKFSNQILMTDSMIVLEWIRRPAQCFKQFVAARVSEIQRKTQIANWRHVPGILNPADDLSRGMRADKLTDRWINGPEFISKPISEWPQEKSDNDTEDTEERRMAFNGNVVVNPGEVDIVECKTWEEMLELYRQRIYGKQSEALNAEKVREIELLLLKRVQKDCFAEEYEVLKNGGKSVAKSSKLVNLDPQFDMESELIQVGGRLKRNDQLEMEVHPVVLDPSHQITQLLIKRIDSNVFNHGAGVEQVFSYIRRRYWILKGRCKIKSILRTCVSCQMWRKSPAVPKMADIPEARTRIGLPPFYSTGMDCWSPMMIKVRISREKRWGGGHL
ncbi:uncharacterized protein LOC117100838 [Anneissia japonica]|uniref:uncharacterized protein LOC117100838 n=1 Tax=Anneissia japonica TaxID=1529436 RepID=UPI0014258100|nr:uncharacterized protein LOC117100838 [Anneissia japonica]